MSYGLLNTRSRTHKRVVDRSALHYVPYFDFGEPEQESLPVANSDNAREKLRSACEDWIGRGNQIVPYTFGVETRGFNRRSFKQGETWITEVVSEGHYEAKGELCDPLGVILDGKPSRMMPMLDACRELEVSEYWIVGFMHGYDRQNVVLIGKHLPTLTESADYLDGKDAGLEFHLRYVKPD